MKTGSEGIVKNEGKEVPEKVDANPSFWSKVSIFEVFDSDMDCTVFSDCIWSGASHGDIGKAVACTWCEVYGVFANRIFI